MIAKRAQRWACIVCAAALILSTYPGALQAIAFPWLCLLAIPLGVFAFSVAARTGAVVLAEIISPRTRDNGHPAGIHWPWRRATITLLILFSTYVALKLYIPRRMTFMTSRSAFERFIATVPASDPKKTTATPPRLGLYFIDQYARDDWGGHYFRTAHHMDGFAPDTMSYGFAYKPNRDKTPFGSQPTLRRLGGGWYWFRVSNDW